MQGSVATDRAPPPNPPPQPSSLLLRLGGRGWGLVHLQGNLLPDLRQCDKGGTECRPIIDCLLGQLHTGARAARCSSVSMCTCTCAHACAATCCCAGMHACTCAQDPACRHMHEYVHEQARACESAAKANTRAVPFLRLYFTIIGHE